MPNEGSYIKYAELIQKLGINNITYYDLLSTHEWKEKRNEILVRDKGRCSICSKSSTIPHFDSSTGKVFNLWFGDEKLSYIKNSSGILEEVYIPEVKASDKPYHLHVHHRYYIVNKLPWEYSNIALITLCNWCHFELHETETVKVYSDDETTVVDVPLCNRCGGTGWFKEYSHINGGVCFKCNGSKIELSSTLPK